MRIVALADSDSYVKWGAALIATLPPEWHRELLVVMTPLTVSDGQLTTALGDSRLDGVRRVTYAELGATLAKLRPDAVLVATIGPLALVLARVVAELDPRPVVLSGMPGISIPASPKALRYRRQADLLVVHSRNEVAGFRELLRARGTHQRIGLATLPFAERRPAAGTDLVFATQSIVPRERPDRVRVAEALRAAALANPASRVVIKTRAAKGEQQTHAEAHDIAELVSGLGPVPDNLVVSTAPMGRALDTAEGLVTVSSTAFIEAVARGIPVIAIDDFGVGPQLINEVFAGSGLFAGLTSVVAREFRHPRPDWLAENYFHDPADSDWIEQLEQLVAARRRGELPERAAAVPFGGRLREAWDRKVALGAHDTSTSGALALLVGRPARAVVSRARRLKLRLRATVSPQ